MAQMATEKRAKIIQNLLRSIKLRLLHPGAFTELIIEFYLMAAQALYCLGTDLVIFSSLYSPDSIQQKDPSGAYMSIICEPIRNYIRARTDSAEVRFVFFWVKFESIVNFRSKFRQL